MWHIHRLQASVCECDEETFNDQAWIFQQKKESKNSAKNAGRKGSSYGYEIYQEGLSRLYGTFYAIGVNTVVWVDGEDKIEIDLPDIANRQI